MLFFYFLFGEVDKIVVSRITRCSLYLDCSQDVLFYGPLDDCPACGGTLKFSERTYSCSGVYTEWSSCTFATRDPPRRNEPTKLPDSVKDSHVADVIFSCL